MNGKPPFMGCVRINNQHNGLYGQGRFLVQNKGLILSAIDKPLPDRVTGGNLTEKAIILAIAMQASAPAAASCLCLPWLQV